MLKIYVHTIGCALNKAESNRMKFILKNYNPNWTLVEDPEEADIIILNTCTVKTIAENTAYRLLRRWKNKKIIVTGCLVEHKPEVFKEYSIVGLYNINKIAEAIEKTIQGETVKYLDKKKENKLNYDSIDQYPVRIIPIQEGCLWKCSYCATRLARKIFQSFKPEDIYKDILRGLNKGIKIFYLTGTDVAAYGFDIKTNIAELLKNIPKEKLYHIRVGMMNPGLINKYLDDLLLAYEDPRIFKFFHIPIQSFSQKVLDDMKRKYSVRDVLEIYKEILKKYPKATLATDIIVGFPTENEEDFKLTLKYLEKYPFDVINISRFWPREGTPAAKMKQLPSDLVKKRSKAVYELFNRVALKKNKQWIGWKGWIIIEEKGRKENSWIGRTSTYKQTIVFTDEDILGKYVKVKITEATSVDIRGKILEISDQIEENEWEI